MGDGRVAVISVPPEGTTSSPGVGMIRFAGAPQPMQVVRTMAPSGHPQYVFVNNGMAPRPMQQILQPRPIQAIQQPSQVDESTKKCASFLSVLQRLSRENKGSDETRPQRVTQIIQEVIEERITTQQFVLKLKEALGSQTNSDQLQGFLNQHLPNYRRAFHMGLVSLEGVRPQQPQVPQQVALRMQHPPRPPPQVVTVMHQQPQLPKHQQQKTAIPDEELNDVTALCGVNLKAESSLPMTLATKETQQQPERRPVLSTALLRRKVLDCAHKAGLPDAADSALRLLSEAAVLRLRQLVERAALAADHRGESPPASLYTCDSAQEPRRQLSFLADVDRAEQQRKEDVERQRLLKAVKSRANDPEQQRLREKAKAMQAREQEADKVAKSNETAMRAIFGRNSRRRAGFGGAAVPVEAAGTPVGGKRPRSTRVSARDLAFVLEKDETAPRRLLQKLLSS